MNEQKNNRLTDREKLVVTLVFNPHKMPPIEGQEFYCRGKMAFSLTPLILGVFVFSFPVWILLGLVLGPSGFDVAVPQPLKESISYSVLGFLLVAGLECSPRLFKQNLKKSLLLAFGTFIGPFVFGFLTADLFGASFCLNGFKSSWFLATALSVSALPVIVQILKESGLFSQAIGQIILAAATFCDLLAWLCFLLILPHEQKGAWMSSHFAVLAFFVGALFSFLKVELMKGGRVLLEINRRILVPLFFLGIGLQIKIMEAFDFSLTLALFLLASLLKVASVYGTAWLLKFSEENRLLASLSLNARGAMEILMASLAYRSGLINEKWFTSLVIMALLTSVVALPLLKWARKKEVVHESALDCSH